ncbi:MAG TPA: presenilin family intramembrane aspartyl protease [Candidatus Paceibacterota bacterium]|nr:presenilin family intramembrane aspartyl protease [Candidatus Paceibacterota bacterium]
MRFTFNLFSKELILFGATLALGLATAYRYLAFVSAQPILQVPSFSVTDIVILAALITGFIVVLQFRRVSQVFLWLMLILVIFAGTIIVFDSFFNPTWDLLAAVVMLTLFFWRRSVLMHDIAIGVSLAGIGAAIGVGITPDLAIIFLLLLSFYDIIAVYKTKHMVKMAEGMLRSGAIFGFIIPSEFSSFLSHHKNAREEIGQRTQRFMLLGSGDIGLPIIFVSSLVRQSLAEAIVVAIFAVAGVMLTHILFVNQPHRRAMAALPPIATMCLVGYVVALLLGL